MTKHELLSFIKSSEKELDCVTPGAYCHRRVAVRAMELLQLQASKEASVAVAEVITTGNQKITALQKELQEAQAVIERQAKALIELQKPGPHGKPFEQTQKDSVLSRMIDQEIYQEYNRTRQLYKRQADPLDHYFKDAKQFPF